MARVNFEDDVEAQDEFWALLPLVGGDRDKAIGRLVRFFRVAQKAYGNNLPMSEEDLKEKGFSDMIASGWAVPVSGGYQALGASKHFDWYRQKVSAGRRGGAAKSENAKKALAAPSVATAAEAGVYPLAPAPAPSLALSKKEEIQKTESNAVALAPAKTPAVKKSKFDEDTRAKMVAFIRKYAEVWKAKYRSNPEGIKDKALIGKIGHWISSVSEQRALDLVQVYLQVDYRPINDSCHDLWQFFRHLNRIGIAMDTGQDTAGIDWNSVFGRSA